MMTAPGAADLEGVSALVREVEQAMKESRQDEARQILSERLPGALRHYALHDPRQRGPLAVHYTTVDATIGILCEGGFRMYNVEASNDPREGKVLESSEFCRHLSARFPWLQISADSPDSEAYVLSAIAPNMKSATHNSIADDLVWWRLYGHDGGGCSITFNSELPSFPMYPVYYPDGSARGRSLSETWPPGLLRIRTALDNLPKSIVDDPGKAGDRLRQHLARTVVNTVATYAYLVKDRHYRAEHEVRVLRVSPAADSVQFDTESGVPVRRFVNGPRLNDCLKTGSAITIGPSVPHPRMLCAFLEKRLREQGCEHTGVRISEARYRH